MTRVPEPPFVSQPHPENRRWVRLKPTPDAHLAQSRRLISELAKEATPGAAIVLGAGRCDEVPVVELADRFEVLSLNDLDRTLLDDAVAHHALAKHEPPVELVVADLTGVTTRFVESAQAALAEAGDPGKATARLSELAEQLRPIPYAPKESYDLIVASCVLSQLHVSAAMRVAQAFAQRFPGTEAIAALRADLGWTAALSRLARRMEDEFINSIYHLLAPGGRAYLSDTVQFCFIHGTADGQWTSDGTYRMTRTTQLSDYLDDRFSVCRLGQWAWIHQPPQAPQQVGRMYNVQALDVSRR